MRLARQLVDIKQRQRAARGLFRATERIAVERLEQRRHIKRGRGTDRELNAASARHEVGEQVARQRDAFALGDRPHGAARQDLRRRLGGERVAALHLEPVRAADADRHVADADRGRVDRQADAGALLAGEADLLLRLAHGERAVGLHADRVLARRTLDIVEVEADGAAIAGEQEARQGRGQHDRIAHRDVARGVADLVLRPGDRHHAYGSGKRRNLELHVRGAVRPHVHDARIERERRLGRRRGARHGARTIAAGADRAARALHAVEQLAVEVADLRRQAALAEVKVIRRRRLVVGQVEDADIDRRDGDLRLLAAGEAAQPDRYAQRAVRAHQARQRHLDAERACPLVDREPLQADGAAGHAARRLVERTAQRRHHIGARAPVAADRDRDLRGARLHVLRGRGQEPVADDIDRDLAGGARRHRHVHGVAGGVFGLVERDLEQVRRVGGGVGIEARVERD